MVEGATTAGFHALADLLPEPMVLVSVDGVMIAANPAFGRLLDAPGEPVAGRTLLDAGWTDPADIEGFLRQCARTRALVLGTATFAHLDGSARTFRCEGARFGVAAETAVVLLRLVSKDQSSARFIALTQKIAELSAQIRRRQLAEQDAREQRELLHVTLTSIGDAVVATDRSGHITFMNEVAEQLTRWPRIEAAGRPLHDIFRIVNESSREPVEDPVAKVLALGQAVGLANHTVLIARDGSERPIDDSAAPIVDASGVMHGVVLVFRDVTMIRAAEHAQAAALLSAEAANRAKDEFLAMLSHELRTPLNAILGWTRMLRRGSLTPERMTHGLVIIERNAEMQARLVEDLLDVSRITSGQLRLQEEAVDIAQVIEAAVEAVRPAAENRDITLAIRSSLDSRVRGDAGRLQQVVWNLLTNAVKFTPAGGTIEVTASSGGNSVRIAVRDSGEGFPAAFRPHLFEAFSQADTSVSRPHGGLGLGLMIVRRLVEAHGGTIDGDSPGVNQGATFTVVLPCGAPARVPLSPPGGPLAQLREARVLVVDDDADSCDLTRTLLEEVGATAVTCLSAREALDLLRREPVDVLLADIGMPGDDGFWLIREIRALPDARQRAVPAIALTAFASPRDRQAALAAGYTDHVSKPLDVERLLASLARILSATDTGA